MNSASWIKRVVIVCFATTLSACGGGGGGGGGGSDSRYGVRVLHAAIDASPVDVVSSSKGEAVVSGAFFGGTKGYRSLPKGAQSLLLTKALSPSQVVASFDVSVESNDRYTLVLYGDNQTFGLRSRLIQDEVPSLSEGAAVRIIHGATGAAALSVSVDGGSPQSVSFGENTDYIAASAGTVRVTTSRMADGRVVTSTAVNLEAGRSYTYLVAGEIGYYVKGVLFVDE